MTVTTHRPAPLPHMAAPGPIPARRNLPDGAAKMQPWYIDAAGRRKRMPYEVPVDADDQRTAHLRFQCPHMRNANGGGKERCPRFEWLLPGAKPRFCPDHGEQLEPPKVEKARMSALFSETRRMYGATAKPWALPAAALAADVAMGLAQVGATKAMLAAPALAAGTYVVRKRQRTRAAIEAKRIERGQRTGKRVQRIRQEARHNAGTAAELGAWLTALAATDPSTWAGRIVLAAGAVRWAIGVVPWWNAAEARRLRNIPASVKVEAPAAEQAPVEAPDPVYLRAVSTWATLIGKPGGPLAGTELVEFKRLPACEVGASIRTRLPNWQAKVVAKEAGSINMRENRPNLLGRIAAAYGCTYADVTFTADEDDLGVARVRVQPDNVLAEVRMWTGPAATDWTKGVSQIGRFDDGLPILYSWWNKQGAVHDLVGGSSGSGKSEVIAQLLLTSLHSNGLVLDWVGDPQGGQSYGHLRDEVDWFARNKAEIKLMLLGAVKEMYRRNDELAANYIKTWRPTKSMPLLVITLDEIQAYIGDADILALVTLLVGMARKVGIKVRLATQIIAAYNMGDTTYIKDQAKIGQTLTFRSETDHAGRSAVEGDSPIDPTALPKVWGKNTCAAGETTAGLMFVQGLHGRDVYGRADYTGDDMRKWLYDADGKPTLSPGVFGSAAQRESGVLWGEREERAKIMLAAGRSDEDLLPGGRATELIELATVLTHPELKAEGEAATAKDSTARDKVLAAAREEADGSGIVKREAIVAATPDMKTGTRDKALGDLVAEGRHMRRVKNGVYEVMSA